MSEPLRVRARRLGSALWCPGGRQRAVAVLHSVSGLNGWCHTPSGLIRHIDAIRSVCALAPLPELLHSAGADFAAAICFDDGYADNYTVAFEVLDRMSVPFAVFVTTGFIQLGCQVMSWSPHYRGLQPLTWPQIREMHRHGVCIGSHTVSHRRLSECSPGRIRRELCDSKARLEDELSTEVSLLAFPFGQPHDCPRIAVDIAGECGYRYCFSTVQRCFRDIRDPLRIPRVTVGASDTALDVVQKCRGARNFMAVCDRLRSGLVRARLLSVGVGKGGNADVEVTR